MAEAVEGAVTVLEHVPALLRARLRACAEVPVRSCVCAVARARGRTLVWVQLLMQVLARRGVLVRTREGELAYVPAMAVVLALALALERVRVRVPARARARMLVVARARACAAAEERALAWAALDARCRRRG